MTMKYVAILSLSVAALAYDAREEVNDRKPAIFSDVSLVQNYPTFRVHPLTDTPLPIMVYPTISCNSEHRISFNASLPAPTSRCITKSTIQEEVSAVYPDYNTVEKIAQYLDYCIPSWKRVVEVGHIPTDPSMYAQQVAQSNSRSTMAQIFIFKECGWITHPANAVATHIFNKLGWENVSGSERDGLELTISIAFLKANAAAFAATAKKPLVIVQDQAAAKLVKKKGTIWDRYVVTQKLVL
jgi:hypothetical protein